MKILLLANHASPHIIKWATALAERNFRILIFSLTAQEVFHYPPELGIQVVSAGLSLQTIRTKRSRLVKLRYLKSLSRLKQAIEEFQPDILHAHRASSYGLLGVLSGFAPRITSVWGEDVFDFPKRSIVHGLLLKFVLARSTCVLSTSRVMAEETANYTKKTVQVTPFGIDLNRFKPFSPKDPLFRSDEIVIGTVKTLEERYGIHYLIRAFKRVAEENPELPLRLLIVGGGSQQQELQQLVRDLGIEEKTAFTGRVPFRDIPNYQNMLSVSVSVSITDSESFGVAIVEASACGVPVIVSDAGGLPEVVEDGKTGIVVPQRNAEATAEAIHTLIEDPALRERMGRAGRKRVEEHYDWRNNVDIMCSIYDTVYNRSGEGRV